MKILLTGSGGMVGKNILESGIASDHEVFSPRRTELDLLDSNAVQRAIKSFQPDLIIHCAGVVGGIQANMNEPVRFFLENMEMGKNVIWAAKQEGVKKLLNLSSSCMYPKDKPTALVEDDILAGKLEPTNEGYALAKIGVAKLCGYISSQDPEFQYKTLIPCNLYGRWDKFDVSYGHMVPAVIKKIHNAVRSHSSEVEIWGDGTSRREFMYAADLADFVNFAVKNFDRIPSMINVGLGHDYTISEYYQQIASVIGFEGKFIFNLDKPTGMKRKLVDVSKATALGWHSKTSLTEGIRLTYKFFLEHEVNH